MTSPVRNIELVQIPDNGIAVLFAARKDWNPCHLKYVSIF